MLPLAGILALSLELSETVEPVPGRVIRVGNEYMADLVLNGVFNKVRRGVEGQLVFRQPLAGGVFLGSGYQWEPARSPM